MLKIKRYSICFPLFALILFSGCPEDEDFKTKMLIEINDLRAEGCWCGTDSMPPARMLLWDESLEKAANRHVRDMALNDSVEHTGSDGSIPQQRTMEAGFMGTYIGENVARGSVTVEGIMERWKNSDKHCRTMMDNYFTYFAVAYEDYCWVQMFGSESFK